MKLTSQSGILIKIKQKDKNSSSTYHKDKIMRWIKKNNSDVENVKVIYFLQISKGKIDLFQSTVVGKKSFSTAWPLNDSSLKRKKKREREIMCVNNYTDIVFPFNVDGSEKCTTIVFGLHFP